MGKALCMCRALGIWGICISQFCCKPKTALKNKVKKYIYTEAQPSKPICPSQN